MQTWHRDYPCREDGCDAVIVFPGWNTVARCANGHPHRHVHDCEEFDCYDYAVPISEAEFAEATPLDKLGRPITVGAIIVYGHALGRCAGLRIGRVMDVRSAPVVYTSDSPWRIRVQGIDDDWAHREVTLCKPGTLMFPNRTIVIDAAELPPHVSALFKLEKP